MGVPILPVVNRIRPETFVDIGVASPFAASSFPFVACLCVGAASGSGLSCCSAVVSTDFSLRELYVFSVGEARGGAGPFHSRSGVHLESFLDLCKDEIRGDEQQVRYIDVTKKTGR